MPAKNLVKKEQNIARYNARCSALKVKQQRAAELKSEFGYLGTPDQILQQHARALHNQALADKFAADLAEVAAKLAKEQNEQRFVEEALAGPSAGVLTKWLATRQPTFERVSRFYNERPNLKRVAEVQKIAA